MEPLSCGKPDPPLPETARMADNLASAMINVSPPVAALTGLDAALGRLLDECRPVAPIECSVAAAIGCVAATMPALVRGLPLRNIATIDGWALNSVDLAGASSYSPVPLFAAPVWVEVG